MVVFGSETQMTEADRATFTKLADTARASAASRTMCASGAAASDMFNFAVLSHDILEATDRYEQIAGLAESLSMDGL
jgi:hypothetical protein